MSANALARSYLGPKYTPKTHEYAVALKADASAKSLEGWVRVGETEAADMGPKVILARPLPKPIVEATAAKPKRRKPAAKKSTAPKRRRH